MAVMRHDIEVAKALGAAGVVLGVLTPEAAIDREQTAELVAWPGRLASRSTRRLTRRASLLEALDTLIALGVDRVLTSGGRPTALEGIENLADLVDRAGRPDRRHGRRPAQHRQPGDRHSAKPGSARSTSVPP